MTNEQIPTEAPKSGDKFQSILSILGRIRPRDRISYVYQAITSIIRNKRRSMSMIAGLILGISILSGIMLYTNVLMINVYHSIIEGEPYEIRIDFEVSITDDQLAQYRQDLEDHALISEAQVLYGNARTVMESTGMSTNIYTKAYLNAEIQVEFNNENYTGSEGRIFTYETYTSEIGKNIREKLITGRNPEIYTPTSSNYLGILISESLAENAKLRQGNKLSRITLEIEVVDHSYFIQSCRKTMIRLYMNSCLIF